MARLETMLGKTKMAEEEGIWRTRYRAYPVALTEAIGELKIAIDRDTKFKTNRAAWLTDKFEEIRDGRRKRG